MAGDAKVTTSPFGSKVSVSAETADRLAQYGYEAQKAAAKRSTSTKDAGDKSA